jgi:hypothetical protein
MMVHQKGDHESPLRGHSGRLSAVHFIRHVQDHKEHSPWVGFDPPFFLD